MIPNQVFEQLASQSFDKAQAIIVMKMLLVTAENVRTQVREEYRQEMAAMRSDYGRLIIEAVEATEEKIFARLEQERLAAEEKKRERRERLAARREEREAAKAAARDAEYLRQDAQGGFDFGCDGVDEDEGGDFQSLGNVVHDEAAGLKPMRGCHDDEQPVTGHIATKFEDNPEYKALVAQWEEEAAKDIRTKPIGSPMAAVKSLGEALAASFQEQSQAQERESQQGAQLTEVPDVKLLAHADDGGGDNVPPQLLEAAE